MKLKTSVSVKQFQLKAQQAWGLEEWGGVDDPDKEVVFFGLYHDRDFEVFANFQGTKHVFWCGGDILRLNQDYERRRIMRNSKNTTHYCDNEIAAESLRKAGFEPIVIPSFVGQIEDYPVSFKKPEDGIWKIWMCGHPRREQEYGFDQARTLAEMFPSVEFHIYGVDKEYEGKVPNSKDNLPNIIYHGLIPETQLDEEIKNYHCGFRANEHDGLSEVIVKSILLGQYPISRIPYEGVWSYQDFGTLIDLIKKLQEQTEPNKLNEIWKTKLNKFPFLQK